MRTRRRERGARIYSMTCRENRPVQAENVAATLILNTRAILGERKAHAEGVGEMTGLRNETLRLALFCTDGLSGEQTWYIVPSLCFLPRPCA